MGLPPYVLEETPQPNGTILRRGRGKAAGFTLEWEEKPYEWIRGRHFRQARVFTKGPFRRFGRCSISSPTAPAARTVSYALEWEPLTWVGRLFGARLAAQAGEAVGKRILEAVAFARGRAGDATFDLPPPELPAGARERAAALAARDRPQPLRQRARPRAGRPRADRPWRPIFAPLKPKRLARELERAVSAPRSRPASPACAPGF